MIRIEGAAGGLADRLEICYNANFDFSLALDILAHPERNRAHTTWSREVLSSLDSGQLGRIGEFEQLLNGWLNLDEYLDPLGFPDGFPESRRAFSDYLADPGSWNGRLAEETREDLVDFLTPLWESRIFPVIDEHRDVLEAQLGEGSRLLEKGPRHLFRAVNDRVTLHRNGEMRIQKRMELVFSIDHLDCFQLTLSLFAFPYLVVADYHRRGQFMLSWDVPFRNAEPSNDSLLQLSRRAFALSDPGRLRILLLLAGSPMTQKDLGRAMGFAKSTISRHISILDEAGFLSADSGERNVTLHLNRRAWSGFPADLQSLLNDLPD